ncbi:hypothetical protein D9615_005387 [Tricholomella constricta]|uniref:Uncharacterized protein n=1 Tax=Tricholomella constricta TaxID=117010 RepID=A0A8H5HEA1_9AGAR|nr:hypothetical protein D9615_005387 [Tricholomella constricta]
MTWDRRIITHQLLQLLPPMLYSPNPYIIYITTHLILTLLFHLFRFILSPSVFAFLDTVLFPPRRPRPPISRPLIASPVTHLIIGALASAGGGLTASTLSTWSPSWSFSTPIQQHSKHTRKTFT